MRIPIYQVDAFAAVPFTGNPAAVCPLEEWLPDSVMQQIAAENNLAETAFFVRQGSGYALRWFTPLVEIDLCGHATLASAFVLWEKLGFAGGLISFETRSGTLTVSRNGDVLALDFPARPPQACEVHPALLVALGGSPREVLASRDYLVVYGSEEEVQALSPNMNAVARLDRFAVIATAPGKQHDFVSRFFAPAQGIPEDPVTGSAHCTLTPYWSAKLGKTTLRAKQISPRGGELLCEDRGERVSIAGKAVLYLEGSIFV
ncbi:MAG: PhzF family phenazine biosynthesis protein [Acidobacteria bacterium]|nr:PhzF family phenazine biosynthesis protein [Acidobacteriota bacterium]